MANEGALSGLYDYARNSYAGLARGARSAREFMDSVTPGPQFFASMLPGAGVVQSGQDAQNARAAFSEGRYGQAFGDAVSSVLNAGSEMLPVAGKVAPAILAGVGARTAPLDKLRQAFAMEKAGATPDEIWRQAGWERGADTKWRFEIPDNQSVVDENLYQSLKSAGSVPMSDLLHHPELYVAYPAIGQLPVDAQPGRGGVYQGSRIGLGADAPITDVRDVLLHEAQHGVQGAEGFATGTNPRYVDVTVRNGFARDLANARTPREAEQIQALFEAFDNNGADAVRNAYLGTAGEVEARNVGTNRLFMAPENRARWRPAATEDPRFPRDRQILPNYAGVPPNPPPADPFGDYVRRLRAQGEL